MDRLRWRRRIGGWGAILVGGVAAIFSVYQWGLNRLIMSSILVLFAIVGALLLSRYAKWAYYLLGAISLLSILRAVVSYLNGEILFVIAFASIGIAALFRAVPVYRGSLQRLITEEER